MESLLSFKFKHCIRFLVVLILLIAVFLFFEKFLISYLYEETNIISNLLKLPFAKGQRDAISLLYLIIIIIFCGYLGWIFHHRLRQYFHKLKSTPFYFATIRESFICVILFVFLHVIINHNGKFQTLHFFRSDFIWFWIALFLLGFLVRHTFEKIACKNINNSVEKIHPLAENPISFWEEDLLDRKSVVNNLLMEINSSFDEGGGVVACYGIRGIGKTSVLNLLKINLKLTELKVVYFQPWRYKDEREMVRNFFSRITNFLTENYSLSFLNSIPQKYTELLLGVPKIPFVDISKISGFLKQEMNYDTLKVEIEAVLRILNIKIIMIIDDLDRCGSKDVFLLLRLFNTIGNFKNVVYLISADLDELEKKIQSPQLVEVI